MKPRRPALTPAIRFVLLHGGSAEHPILRLQKKVGNREVARWLQARDTQAAVADPQIPRSRLRSRRAWILALVTLLALLAVILAVSFVGTAH